MLITSTKVPLRCSIILYSDLKVIKHRMGTLVYYGGYVAKRGTLCVTIGYFT